MGWRFFCGYSLVWLFSGISVLSDYRVAVKLLYTSKQYFSFPRRGYVSNPKNRAKTKHKFFLNYKNPKCIIIKPGSFTQLYTQFVFAVKHRKALLTKEIRPQIFSYMGGIINDLGHKTIIVNGVSDHVHLFLGTNPKVSISDTVHDIKRSTSILINDNRLSNFQFNWQDGYGAFSYSRSHIDNVFKYIQNQEQHHKKEKFRTEYIQFLKKFDIEFEERFLFDFFD